MFPGLPPEYTTASHPASDTDSGHAHNAGPPGDTHPRGGSATDPGFPTWQNRTATLNTCSSNTYASPAFGCT
jgi:hypothetical protein